MIFIIVFVVPNPPEPTKSYFPPCLEFISHAGRRRLELPDAVEADVGHVNGACGRKCSDVMDHAESLRQRKYGFMIRTIIVRE